MVKSIKEEITPEELVKGGPDRLVVRVNSITYQGEELNEYELVDPSGQSLPPFSPGSHVDIYFRDGRVRQYSLCGDERSKAYRLVIQRELAGRGGSRDFFHKVHVGRLLVISRPRNNFKLMPAEKYILIAGGIGITPIISMARSLVRSGKQFDLHYTTRTKSRTALLTELNALCPPGSLHVCHDGGDPKQGLDLKGILSKPGIGTHLYYCGPVGLMRAISTNTADWSKDQVHAEYFSAVHSSEQLAQTNQLDATFDVLIASSNQRLEVPSDQSILQVLRKNGLDVPTSCEAGVCGTCRVHFLEGIPDHRDLILQDEEKTRELLVCCSRSLTPLLVLDL